MIANTVRELVDHQESARPNSIYAVDAEGLQSISFGGLVSSCRQIASLLISRGSQPGETISVVMPNSLGAIQILVGAMYGGWTVNPINLLSQPSQMRYVLDHSDCIIVVVCKEWEERVREMIRGIARAIKVILSDDLAGEHGEGGVNTPPPSPDDIALLMYTSGTTGVPKGVMLSQRNLAANALAISKEHALSPKDRVLAVLPLYHINAFAVTMLAPIAHGGSLSMPTKFSAGNFWSQASLGHCTWINLVPTMISYLLEGVQPPADQLNGIRFCRSASAALPPDHLHAFEQKFGIGIIETMGLTETVAPSFSNPLEPSQRKIGSVGKASGCEARVIDTQLKEVPDGSTGELAIRGPNVMLGYYKNEDATRSTFTPDGWLRTGDLGHRDSDGFFFVTGRIKELIIKGGENISPREIDEALLQHPAVLEAAAVGISDKHYGQEIGVCVVLRVGVTCNEDDLRVFCNEALGKYKTPAHYRFVDDLPRGPSGKVQRLKMIPLFENASLNLPRSKDQGF